MTQEGQVLGTPAYMSPEQARGESHRVDGRADVYSLGAILYLLLTGVPPFQGNARMVVRQAIHDDPVNPRQLHSDVPRDLETICLKCLEKEPRRRFATADEVADELGRYLRDEPIRSRPITRLGRFRRWCARNKTIAVLAFGLSFALITGLVGVGAMWLRASTTNCRKRIHAQGDGGRRTRRKNAKAGACQRDCRPTAATPHQALSLRCTHESHPAGVGCCQHRPHARAAGAVHSETPWAIEVLGRTQRTTTIANFQSRDAA